MKRECRNFAKNCRALNCTFDDITELAEDDNDKRNSIYFI